MIRPEVEKLRGYTFTEEEWNEVILPGSYVDSESKLAYTRYMIDELKKKRSDVHFAFALGTPYFAAVSKKMNPYGTSESDALKFAKVVYQEAFSVLTLADGTLVPNTHFNVERVNFEIESEDEGSYTVKMTLADNRPEESTLAKEDLNRIRKFFVTVKGYFPGIGKEEEVEVPTKEEYDDFRQRINATLDMLDKKIEGLKAKAD